MMYRRGSTKKALVALAFLALGLAACGRGAVSQDVLPSSGLGPVTRAELEDYTLSLPEKRRSPAEGQERTEWRRSLVAELLDSRALAAEAQQRSLAETPEIATELEARREAVLAAEVRDRRIRERVQITDEGLRAFYDANPEEFGHGERIRLRNIFRRVDRGAPATVRTAARREMESLLDELRQGASFADLAKAHSDSETADLGGLIGKIDRGVFTPELEKVIWSLKDGELSEVVATPVGFQIFKLESHIPPFKMAFEEARGKLRRRLTQEATEAVVEELFEELLAASGAVYRPDLLAGEDQEAVLLALDENRLTLADWRRRQQSKSLYARREPAPKEQLATLVRDRLFAWEAARQGIVEEPAIAEPLAAIERSVLSGRVARENLERELAESEESSLQTYYETYQRRYQSPKLVHLHILTRDFPGGEVSYKLYGELEQLARDLRAGARDFGAAARELSEDLSAYRGGDLGPVRLDVFAEWAGPAAQRKVGELADGEVSAPMLIERYDDQLLRYERLGYMLVKLEAVHEPAIRPYDEVRERVVRDYLRQHGDELGRRLREQRLAAIGAEIHDENLVSPGS